MRLLRRFGRLVLVSTPVLAALSLGACSTIDAITPSADSGVGKFLRGTTAEPTTIDLEQYRTKVSCPPVEILPDTQTLRVTTGKSEFEEGVVRYQATLATTARECAQGSDGKQVRVGLAGRALSGPKGAAGTIKLPLRVVVREGDSVTYSKLHVVTVELTSAEPSKDWAFVDSNIVIKDPEIAKILVGFDEKGR